MHAQKLAHEERVLCASLAYIQAHGRPKSLQDLNSHNCLTTIGQEYWRLDGPDGTKSCRPRGALRTNSTEVVRDAVVSGVGIGLCATWDIGPALKAGELKVVLPKYTGTSNTAIHAVFPSRDFVPAKVHAFVDYLADIYACESYWKKKTVSRLKAA
jgi:DNA-binding transcriptional LysR family regulator